MKKLLSTLLITSALAGISPAVYAQGITTYDPSAIIQLKEQIDRMKEQIEYADQQLKKSQEMYNSTTGFRGFGDLLRETEFNQYLPDDMKNIYNSMGREGLEGLQSSLDEILRQETEALTGSYQSSQQNAIQRSRETAAVNKAMGQKAYEGAAKRFEQLDELMDEISKTEDQKAIQELQARIAAEQAAIQNELHKANLVAQLAEAEEALVELQKDEAVRQEFDSTRKGMPGIR